MKCKKCKNYEPEEPKFKVGDIVIRIAHLDVCTIRRITKGGLCILEDCNHNDIGGYSCEELRLATPAEAARYKDAKKPKEPKFKVGDIVADTIGERVWVVIEVHNGWCRLTTPNAHIAERSVLELRLATPAEVSRYKDARYTRWYGDVGIRAYKNKDGISMVFCHNMDTNFKIFEHIYGEALCAALNPPLPIYVLAPDEEPVYPQERGEK